MDVLKFLLLFLLFSLVSHQHLYLAPAGLPCHGCGALPGLHALLAACVHHTCGQNERSHAAHHPAHGPRGHPGAQTGKGIPQQTLVVHTVIPTSSQQPKLFSSRLAVRAEFCSAATEQLIFITINTLFMESIFLLSVSFFMGSWIKLTLIFKKILKCYHIIFIPLFLKSFSLQTSCH